ncbi:PLP-dependent aminotransferase family protein [Agromyces italicus]|uniref:MocR-like pyridoxine biosynthesis transcription factor PdxR n=1 Tax=Agromyces italicus TaxID=279572 RepID=UPI0003B40AEE|nr:PLP-dependent aminotransferase family protein [Agromyces italicus]
MDGPLLVLDPRDGAPIGVRLVDGVRRGILGGLLAPGDPVPSTRALAAELGVSRSSVVAAYEQLAGEGYLELRQGAPTRVARLVVEPEASAPSLSPSPSPVAGPSDRTGPEAPRGDEPPLLRIDLLPGIPSTARIDERAWRSAWRRAAAAPIPRSSPPRAGLAGLRVEIADHLRQARGVGCTSDDLVVTAGTSDALGLLGAALLELARDDGGAGGAPPVVAVEHPGYPSARRLLERRGLVIAPLPVDADGLDLDALRRMPRPPQAVMVTPSHQYPLGGRLPVASRLELIDWARATGALIIEDDYDSEFRHLGAPLPALASLDRLGAAGGRTGPGTERSSERTVLVGSFSKVLTPWLRLGYLVLPADPALRAAVLRIRADEPCPVAGPAQEAMRVFLASGALRRHIAATRRDYAHRRRMVQSVLGELPGAPLSGLDGGLHAVVGLHDAEASAAIVARLAEEGVGVAPLADYSAVPGERPGGIVFGYAGVGDALLGEGLARIRAALVDTLAPGRRE